MFISIMLGVTIIYDAVLSFADYVLLVCMSIMIVPYWSCDDPYGEQSLRINNNASSIPSLKMMHHGFGICGELVFSLKYFYSLILIMVWVFNFMLVWHLVWFWSWLYGWLGYEVSKVFIISASKFWTSRYIITRAIMLW